MKLNLIVSSLLAIAATTTPSVMFGAAADLNACCTPGDKDQPKVGGNLGNQSYSSLNQIRKGNVDKLGPAWMTSVSEQPATTTDIARTLSLSKERIRQLEARAVSKLRHPSVESEARDLLAG